MGLLDNVLSTIDAKKRTLKRGLMDMLDNPSQWAGMQANRIQEDRYGGAENAQAMKQYLTKQPYDPKALTAANDALRNAAINESLGAITSNVPKITEFEQRHLVAQRNAALPVEQGGLGLPPNNTAMDRAKAMGFNQEAYHTSRTGVDTNVLDSGKYAIAPFDAIGTHFGTKEAAFDRFNRTVGTTEQIKGSSYPVLIKNDRQLLNDSADYYKEEPLGLMLSAQSDYGNLPKSNAALREKYFNSYDVIPYVNDVESAGSVSYIAPPANIRSRFAAFDPMRRHEADLLGYADPRLLGAMAGGGLLGLGGYSLMGDQ